MAREPVKRQLQHHLCGSCRPGALAFDVFEALEKTADIQQQPAEFRADGVERLMHPLARADHHVGECGAAFTAGAAAAGSDRAHPIGGGARHQMGAGEIDAQPLAGLKLMRFDEGTAVAPTTARKPGQRTFRFVDGDIGAAELGRDLALGQLKMLPEKAVDRRLRRLRWTGWELLGRDRS